MRPVLASLLVIVLLMGIAYAETAKKRPRGIHRTGVEPLKNGECPGEHPIKGNFTTYSGERCIYHMIGQRLYLRTKAERCYATEAEAIQDGCRRSKV